MVLKTDAENVRNEEVLKKRETTVQENGGNEEVLKKNGGKF